MASERLRADSSSMRNIKYIDLFCGIGGFRIAVEEACEELNIKADSVLACDIDSSCRKAYQHNFSHIPLSDIRSIATDAVPDHDLLLAGFPCQPFSIIGDRQGFSDVHNGPLFFEITRFLNCSRPQYFVLENVKRLIGHDNGRTLDTILHELKSIGYKVDHRVLNALDFGLPQKRERVFIVGSLSSLENFSWPEGGIAMQPLKEILEDDIAVPQKYWASEYIVKRRKSMHVAQQFPTIWHENKGGNISSHPYSCALRASASYNYLLVNGERRFTPREMLRLQGFPDTFELVCSDSQTRNQAGNSLPVTVARAVIKALIFDVQKRA